MKDKILVVDDEKQIMEYICSSLRRDGFEVVGTTDAEKALEMVDEEKPDLIISDLKMPFMDGVELCWMIRQNSSVPMVPFVFLTGYDDEDLQINGFRAGADAYLLKPIQRSKLLTVVSSLIRRYRKLQQVGQTKGSGIAGNTEEISQVEMLQFLSSNKKTGIFILKQNTVVGKIYLRDGEIINASFADIDGIEAAEMIITNMEGEYSFSKEEFDVEDIIQMPTIKLLMDVSRIQDEKSK